MHPEHPSPSDIDVTKQLMGVFDNSLRDISAWWIIKFCQDRGKGWEPFPLEELEAYCLTFNHHPFHLHGLNWQGFLVRVSEDQWEVTTEFVLRCYRESPARPLGTTGGDNATS